MQLSYQQGEEIIALLKQLVALQDGSALQADTPWVLALIHEYTTGDDQDGNGHVYGEDFIFNQTIESHPKALQSIAKELNSKWTGSRMSFLEYYKTLGENHAQQEKIMAFLKKLDDRQRS